VVTRGSSVVTPLIYVEDMVQHVQGYVTTASNEDRKRQCLDLATRITNLNFPSRLNRAVQYGSGIVAHAQASIKDLHTLRSHRSMGLNASGAAPALSTDTAIASTMTLSLLLLTLLRLLSCAISPLRSMLRGYRHRHPSVP